MANEDQLKILKQGVKLWNAWREKHFDKEIDLIGANLREANLIRASLTRAHLIGADLRKADLREADLFEAHLEGAHLEGAHLEGIHLAGAHLRETHLAGTHLREAHLRGAHLEGAHLSGATLREAHLGRANLREAHLEGADLSGAHLEGADLSRAHLEETHLSGATLYRADLCHANLGSAILSHATITGACLYNTARDDWIIDGIQCGYVFWDDKPDFSDREKEEEKQWELEHRFPKDRDFRPGEFEELYKQLPTFEYTFEHCVTDLDAVVMSRIVQVINKKHPEFELKLDSFCFKERPHAKFTVLHKEHIEEAKKQVVTNYESRIAALEGKQEQLMELISTLINKPQYIGRDYIAINGKTYR